jgi:formyltetrahydrofolate-dependent phosphoribosylglycinamide formyltransferase
VVEKVKTCVFISGTGSNLNSLIKNSKKHNFPIKIGLIISNNKKAKGNSIAKKNSIPFKCLSYSVQKNFEKKALTEIQNRKIKFLCLAGFMKILSKNFIKKFNNKIVNIHPSLLPKYKGLNTHARVLKNKEKYSGCTVHFVNSKLDSGKIIAQKKVLVAKNDTVKSLRHKILLQEHKLYSKSLVSIFK